MSRISIKIVSAAFGALMSAVMLACAWPVSAVALDFRIVRLVNGGNRPDLPCCTPFYIFYTPVIDGNRVAFLSRNGPPDGVWSGNVATRTVTKLVGLNTPAPGGSGNFTAFYGGSDGAEHALAIGGGYVAFFAADGAGVFGLYTVPVTGGAVRRVATTNTVAPDGAEFTHFRHASLNGPTVVFWGSTPAHPDGIYRATRNGTQLQTIIDSDDRLDARTPSGPVADYFQYFSRPAIGRGSNIAFYASGGFDPVSGPNAIFRVTEFVDIADNMTRLPTRPDNSHVRITGFSAAVDSAAIAFRADQPNNGFAGIFRAKTKFTADAFVTTEMRLPGSARKFAAFYGFGYDNTGLAFTATHQVPSGFQQGVYFLPRPGQPIVRVASGSQYYLPMVGDRSISDGKIVFMEGTNYADTVFVAVPVEP